jgi:hypothetical protein
MAILSLQKKKDGARGSTQLSLYSFPDPDPIN